MRRLTGPTVLAALTLLAPPPPAGASSPAGRQAAFARAALRYGVPESVLLAVSYLESRWDAHDGLPSVSAGYGPMHLVDPSAGAGGAAATTRPAGDAGDTARPAGDAAR
ncbi:N-acetylmuramoyl-L-alanine amidase, partial [Streptosporangium sandarakinum]